MNEYIARAVAPAIKIAALTVVGAIIYLIMPESMQIWIKAQAEWVWNKLPSIK
jgi:hypothetical protein